MTPLEIQMLCTHAPAYQKGCVACSVRYMRMLRSPDAKTSRRLQDGYLQTLPASMARQVKEILVKEHECQS